MEILLLLLIVVLLFYFKSEFSSKLGRLEEKIRELNRLIESQKKQEKPIEKIEVITKTQSLEDKPIQHFQEPKPIIVAEIEKENIEPAKIIATNNINYPKPEYSIPNSKPYIPKKSWWVDFKDKNPDLEKFIGENLINKIGILILVLGISYFVKYAIDKNWINEPARVGIGILCGALVLGFAHKLQQNFAPFSSVLVAGAFAIFYFTIGIAFHDYHLFNQTIAFVIMVIITAFSCFISLSYNRKELAVLSLIGGFSVPFMVSTGAGNYVVLFTYILILNIGILAMAYYKKWSIITVLSFLFTVLLYGGWLFENKYDKQPHYLGALLFGFAFYFLFVLITIINNIKTKGVFTKTELTILSGNTFLFYGAGMVILEDFHPEFKGLFTTVLGLLNLCYAWFLYKKFGLDKKAVYLLIGLTLTFATLAIPIQFKGNYITLFWSAEAVLLLWLSQKSKISSYRFASVIVHALMLISLIMDWNTIYSSTDVLNIVINPICITGLFSVISLFTSRYLVKSETDTIKLFSIVFNPTLYRMYAGILGLTLLYFVGLFETFYQANNYIELQNSVLAIPALYHLLFSAILMYYFLKTNKSYAYKFTTIIAALNIILFAFWFSNFAFGEHEKFISTGIHQRIAFYLHFVSLATIVYFGYQLYKTNQKKTSFDILKYKIFIWIAAFFVVFLSSKEVLLHSLVFSNSPVSMQDVKTHFANSDYQNESKEFIRNYIGQNYIHNVTTQTIKTGYPILWGILAFVILILGIKKQNKSLRIIALSLLGLTILKLFLFDISNASETGKIIAFILLGVLILIISFVYQKLKILVLDDSKSNTTDENK